MYRLFVLFFVVTGCLSAFGQTLDLTKHGKVEVNGQLSYLRDETLSLTLNDVMAMPFTPPNSKYSPNIGFDRAAHWFKLDIRNQSDVEEWLAEVAYSPLDQIDFYVLENDSVVVQKTAGDHFPIYRRDLPHRHPIFAFNIQPSTAKSVYLRVQTISSVQVPVTFWHRDSFLKTSYKVQLLNGLFYGAMLLMILYQSFLFLSVRDKI